MKMKTIEEEANGQHMFYTPPPYGILLYQRKRETRPVEVMKRQNFLKNMFRRKGLVKKFADIEKRKTHTQKKHDEVKS